MEKYARSAFSALAIVALLAAGCGDDNGDDDNGGNNVPPPPSGTITAASRGAITVVEDNPNRITVNGVVVPTTNATIRVEDNPASHANLAPGMVVTVKRHDNGGFEIEYEDAVKGTVDSGSVTGTGFTVAGVPVRFDDSTHFEDNTTRQNGISNVRVEVSGFPDDNGGLRATRVFRTGTDDSAFEFEVKGFVAATPAPTATTFSLNLAPGAASPQVLNVVLAGGQTMPPFVQPGAIVEVRGTKSGNTVNVAAAANITREDRLHNGAVQAEVEGIVASGTSASFIVNGITVTTSATTRFEGGTPADVAPGARLEAEGQLSADGTTITARKVSFRDNIEIVAPVTGANSTAGTFQVLGLTVRVDANTEVEGAFPANDAIVEVRGQKAREGNQIVATRLRPRPGENRLELQGPIDSENPTAGTVVILGIATTAPSDGYRDSQNDDTSAEVVLTRDQFFSAIAPGSVVKAQSENNATGLNAGVFPARELEIEELFTTVLTGP